MSWQAEIQQALYDFLTVTALAGRPLSAHDLQTEFLPAPHKPPSKMPAGKMAVYGFYCAGQWLKIGIAGPNSQARYTSQHYNPHSARSTLAASLLKDPGMRQRFTLQEPTVGKWIKSHCHRVNILLPAAHDRLLLALLEAFLHLRLHPRYEK